MGKQHCSTSQPRDSSEMLPALPIAHSLAKPCRSPAESYRYHGRGNETHGLTPAPNADPQCCHIRLPSVPGNVSAVHQHPQTQGNVWGCTTLPRISADVHSRTQQSVLLEKVKTWQTDRTLTKRPGFPKSLVLSWKLAEMFSPVLKQEVAPLSQQTAESLWALRCCSNTQGFLCFTVFYVLAFLFFNIIRKQCSVSL